MEIADNDAAALSAKYVPKGIDMDAAGVQYSVSAGFFLNSGQGSVGNERGDGLGGFARKTTAINLNHLAKKQAVLGFKKRVDRGAVIEVFFPADFDFFGAENLARKGSEGPDGFDRDKLCMEWVETDRQFPQPDLFEKMEFFSGIRQILCPETVRFEGIEGRQVSGSGLLEQTRQMFKIEEGFAACDMEAGGWSSQLNQGGPRLQSRLSGYQSFRKGAARVGTKATCGGAPVGQ